MNKMVGVIAIGFILNGCVAAPPALITLGYLKTGADVVSYATTKKSTTDHAISAYMDKDCALHRAVTEDKVCKSTMKQLLAEIASEYENDGLTAY